MKRTDPPLTSDNRSGASLSPTNFARRRAFDAIADFFERLHRPPFTVSQAVSIARALRPYAQQEARRRRAHGLTAPGRRKSTGHDHSAFQSREWVARCVRIRAGDTAKGRNSGRRRRARSSFFRPCDENGFRALPKPFIEGTSRRTICERLRRTHGVACGARIRRALRKGTNADRDLFVSLRFTARKVSRACTKAFASCGTARRSQTKASITMPNGSPSIASASCAP